MLKSLRIFSFLIYILNISNDLPVWGFSHLLDWNLQCLKNVYVYPYMYTSMYVVHNHVDYFSCYCGIMPVRSNLREESITLVHSFRWVQSHYGREGVVAAALSGAIPVGMWDWQIRRPRGRLEARPGCLLQRPALHLFALWAPKCKGFIALKIVSWAGDHMYKHGSL